MAEFPLIDAVVALAWAAAAVTGMMYAERWWRRRGVRSRVASLHLSAQSGPPPGPLERVGVRSGATRLGERLIRGSDAGLQRRRRLIDSSGLRGRISPAELFGWQVILAGGGLVLGLVAVATRPPEGILAVPVLAVGGFVAPIVWLAQRKRLRFQQLLRDMPTVIDLLALSLAAGMGLDRALNTVCERVRSPLTDELHRVLSDISLGISREEAFLRLAERAPYEDIRSLTRAIMQSEQLGTSLVATVQEQARQLRTVRKRRAEAQALQAPIKMLIPMVLFILPTLFLVVLGPPFLRLGQVFGEVNP